MTAQVPDSIELDGVEYALAGYAGTGLFDPAAHGVEPQMIHTGCWRGFICRYAVRGDELHLDTLRLGRGSRVAGTPLEPGVTTLLGATLEEAWQFRFAALPVPYTGTLLAADGFVQSTYVHMGFAPAWKFEKVVELTLDSGRVTARRDLSESMARTRRAIESGERANPDGPPGGPGWIARTFGRGYDRSAGEPRPPSP
ncbi:MAG TPA: hypothetical protein VNA14_04625 [Mycobacteriales bacterium]|nr:hypothetical protein [Mycobacteriales bacterium]